MPWQGGLLELRIIGVIGPEAGLQRATRYRIAGISQSVSGR